MPRDKNRRPRRRPKTQEEEENNQINEIKPEEIEQTIDNQDNQIGDDNYEAEERFNGGRPSYIDPASFGQVEPEVQHYFKNLEKVIDDKDNVPEDLDLMIESAFSEIKNKEYQLFVDHECSRVLEKILCLAPTYRIIQLLNVLNQKLLTCLTHRFASHVCQTLIILSSEILDRECKGQPVKIPEDLKEEIGELPTMEELFISIANNLSGRWSDLIFDTFASHVLRVVLQVFHGSPIEDANSHKSVVKSKSSKKYMEAKSGGNFIAPKLEGNRQVPDSFKELLKNVTTELIVDVSETVLRTTVFHTTASPVIQLLLQIQSKKDGPESVDAYVNTLLHDIPTEEDIINQGDKVKNPYVLAIIKDNVGSHLFEKIVQVISNSMYNRIYQLYFRNKMVDLSLHGTGNFVIQSLISNARSEAQLQSMIDEVVPSFERLLKIGRPGVVRSVVDACLNLNACYKEAVKGLMSAFHINTPTEQKDLIHVVLRMESYPTYKQYEHEKVKYHLQGSTLLQSLIKYPEPHNGLVINSILSQSSETLLSLSKDQTASFIIEKILKLDNINLKVKRRILNAFDGSFHLLATDKFAGRILDACWAIADIKDKEKIASELVQHESLLATNFFGKFALRNCKIESFKYKKDDWILREEGFDRKKQMFNEIFDEKDQSLFTKKKSLLANSLKPSVAHEDNNENEKNGEKNLLNNNKVSEIDDLFSKVKKENKEDDIINKNIEIEKPKRNKKNKKKDKDMEDILEAITFSSGKKKRKKEEKKDQKKEKKEKKEKKSEDKVKKEESNGNIFSDINEDSRK